MNSENYKNSISQKGMTLAELLLTITVIGIVATMSIPSMLTSINRTKNITAFKKSYTNITQLGFYIKEEMGGVLTASVTTNHDYWYNYFIKYLSYAAAYNSTQSVLARKLIGKNGFFSTLSTSDPTLYTVSTFFGATGYESGFLLNDGSTIMIEGYDQVPVYLIIDTNGIKGPNCLGKDIFQINIQKNGNVQSTEYNTPCDSANYGYGRCGEDILSGAYNIN